MSKDFNARGLLPELHFPDLARNGPKLRMSGLLWAKSSDLLGLNLTVDVTFCSFCVGFKSGTFLLFVMKSSRN